MRRWESQLCSVVVTTYTREHIYTLMKDAETQKVITEGGMLKFLLDFYLKLMQRLVISSLNFCFYLFSKIMLNIVGVSVDILNNSKSPEELSQKESYSNNWVRIL